MLCSVRNLMIPLSEYLTVDSETTLQEAVLTLKRARSDRRDSSHGDNILAIDQEQRVVGKLSPLDMIRGLEDGYQKIGEIKGVDHFGYNAPFIKTLMNRGRLWERPLSHLCRKSAEIKIKDIMNTPTNGEHIDAGDSLNEAIHQMIMTRHHSLLVVENNHITGVLRLKDVFDFIGREMAACKTESVPDNTAG